MYTIHLNAFTSPLVAEGFAHLKDAPFRCGVRRYISSSKVRYDRSDVYDLPWTIQMNQMSSKLLGRDKVGFEINIKDLYHEQC